MNKKTLRQLALITALQASMADKTGFNPYIMGVGAGNKESNGIKTYVITMKRKHGKRHGKRG